MKKKLLSLLIIFMLSAQGLMVPEARAAVSALPISAPSALLLDSSNRIVYAKTPHLRRAPASTTKLLTAIVALKLMSPDEMIVVPKYAERMEPSKIYLRAGERYRVGDLIKAILVNSANDAAAAIAIAGSGSISAFAKEMNLTARSLGCKDSNFVNPNGLPDARQFSTVYDMALIMREAQRYPFIQQALKVRTGVIQSSTGRRIGLRNHNKMLWRDPREVLGKTGWTRSARHCFVGQISVSGKRVFVAMLGSHRLWKDLKTLVDYQFGALVFKKAVRNTKIAGREQNKKVQLALKRAGFYRGAIDGVVGRGTRAAIKKYQRKHGLTQTGSVGPRTWALLKRNL